jgi:hypothetical protein
MWGPFMPKLGMGVYGNYYLKRAIVTKVLFDDTHQPLDGSNKYTIHFDRDTMPPVNADVFWSITLYDKDGFQIANSLHRFAVSGWMPFKY